MSKSKIAADNGLSTGHESEFQIFVVLCIAAVGHAHDRIKPYRCAPENFQDALASLERYRLRELPARESLGDLSVDRGRKCEYVNLFGAQQRTLRYAIRL